VILDAAIGSVTLRTVHQTMNFKRLARFLPLLIDFVRAQRQCTRGCPVTIQIRIVKRIVDSSLFESQCLKFAQELCAALAIGQNGWIGHARFAASELPGQVVESASVAASAVARLRANEGGSRLPRLLSSCLK
jgi:hypothetical protein